MAETIQTYPSQITGISGERQAVVLVLLAHREDADGNIQQLTASQKEAARNAAQAALEITPGTEVLGTSTALLLPEVDLAEGFAAGNGHAAAGVFKEVLATATSSCRIRSRSPTRAT